MTVKEPSPKINREQVLAHLTLLLAANVTVQVCGLEKPGSKRPRESVLVREPAHGVEVAERLAREGWPKLYVSLQSVQPAMPAGRAAGNEHIERINFLALDLDLKEGSEDPLAAAWSVVEQLRGLGFPDPVYVLDSGHGAHVVYRVDGRAGIEKVSHRLRDVLLELGRTLSLPKGIELDVGLWDPARIVRLAGSVNPKTGRQAALLETHPDAMIVASGLLDSIGGFEKASKPPSTKRPSNVYEGDIESLRSIATEKGLNPGAPKKQVHGVAFGCACWIGHANAKAPAYVLLRDDGSIFGKCHVPDCAAHGKKGTSTLVEAFGLATQGYVDGKEYAQSAFDAVRMRYDVQGGGALFPVQLLEVGGPLFIRARSARAVIEITRVRTGAQVTTDDYDYWLISQQRIEGFVYEVTLPFFELTPERMLNLWSGLAVEPQEHKKENARLKAWELMIERHLCSGHREAAQYLLNLFAWRLQRPTELPQAGVYLTGDQGCGKSATMMPIINILGAHGLYLGSAVGRWTDRLASRSLVYHDESHFATSEDRHRIAAVRAMVSEPQLQIEGKGRDIEWVQNFGLHVLATNEHPRLLPGDRRFLVTRGTVGSNREATRAWFIDQRLDTAHRSPEFLSALLHRLLERDIGRFDPRDIPVTDAKEGAEERGRNELQQWVAACQDARAFIGDQTDSPIPCGPEGVWFGSSGEINPGVPTAYTTRQLHGYFERWVREQWRNVGMIHRVTGGAGPKALMVELRSLHRAENKVVDTPGRKNRTKVSGWLIRL